MGLTTTVCTRFRDQRRFLSSGVGHQPLKGLKILDFSRVLAGPWCTQLLGDAGATVVKVERPDGGGDDTRKWGPPFVSSDQSLSTYFLSVNRNKQSIAVDLKHPKGQAICQQLATEWADVLVENFRVGTMERYGLGYEQLSSKKESLVYCSITGFGPTGPYADRPGYDVILSGMYGLMSITGTKDEPAKVGVAMTDLLTGSLAQAGILSALYERQTTGKGRHVNVSLMETQLASLVNVATSCLNTSHGTSPPTRWGTAHASIVPYQAFRCKTASTLSADTSSGGGSEHEPQYVVVGAGNDRQFQLLCDAMGLAHLLDDDRFRTNALRVQHRKDLIPVLEDRFLQATRDDWFQQLDGRGFPVGPVRSVPEAFACEQALHRQMVQTLEHPSVGPIHLPRSPISFSSSIQDSRALPPPMLGQDTRNVLSEVLGKSSSEIEALIHEGVILDYRHEDNDSPGA